MWVCLGLSKLKEIGKGARVTTIKCGMVDGMAGVQFATSIEHN